MTDISNVRAKLCLTRVTTETYNAGHTKKVFHFQVQYDSTLAEDVRFAKASPSGGFEIHIDNPPVIAYYEARIGKYFYLDMTEAN